MYSFFNAGSGTNQSNHMYKLGPVHQGIVERGSKTGSFSYLLWPSKVGPYSVVMGKHGGNFDTSDLPFSYLTVENEKSFLTPAMNLLTVGTRRDSEKWPQRDRRKGQRKLDLIHFDLFNPFIICKILKGIDILINLYENTPKERETANYNGVRIKRLMLKSCRKYYEMALHIFIGDQMLKKLGSLKNPSSMDEIRHLFIQEDEKMNTDWIDMAGLVVPSHALKKSMTQIGDIDDLKLVEIEDLFKNLYDNYGSFTWDFTLGILKDRFDISSADFTKENLGDIISKWAENRIRLNNMIMSDAKKEFDANSRIGFGLGGDELSRDADFEEVRGSYEENSFVMGLKDDNVKIERIAADMLRKLKKIT
jgi:hypothetical protein